MAKTLFFKLMGKKYRRAKNLSRLIYLSSVERAICNNVFRTKYSKGKHYKMFIWYFHKLSVQDYLHEHYCTLEQFIGKTLIEIDWQNTKQTKNVRFCFFQNILWAAAFYQRESDIQKHILNLVLE